MFVLDIGSGKDWNIWIDLLESGEIDSVDCVDTRYNYDHIKSIHPNLSLISQEIFHFLESKITRNYNFIFAERVFEHIPYDKLSYLFYLLYECSCKGAELVIIVPDFAKVGKELRECVSLGRNAKLFNKWLIDIHTETFNEPGDPHQSIWTPELGTYYIELEGYWKLQTIREIERDNRAWYTEFRAISTRPKLDINDIITPVPVLKGEVNEFK